MIIKLKESSFFYYYYYLRPASSVSYMGVEMKVE